ncbi:MAG: hypothetical protein SCALA702_22350 [Melioribacteraceae bacterium]|nr:MAG: hypothetical protein SCALA702_22350 [Melioribacteraceae bacterium]
MKKININWQILTSIYILFSFVIMTFTGIILFFAPHGRIAHWTYWTFLGLQKESWQAVHTVFTFIFVFAGIMHLYFNWNAIKLYLTSKFANTLKYGFELAISLFVVFILFFGSAAELPPFSNLMDFGEYLSESWGTEDTEPPVPHAEDLSLKELALATKTDINLIISNLEKVGIIVLSGNEILQDIADRANVSPSEMFAVINSGTETYNHIRSGLGGGYGRMTVQELCVKSGVLPDEGLKRLMAKGIPAEPELKIKDVAIEHRKQPVEIAEIILDKKLIEEAI